MTKPFKKISYVNIPAQPGLGDDRIIGAKVKDNGEPLMKGADYAHDAFMFYAKNKTFGCVLAMRVMQSDLYEQLDDTERTECDELIRRWHEHLKQGGLK